MPIPLLAPLIGAAASIGSSLIKNSGSKKSQKRADRYNQAQWNRENEYNSPTSQMSRLREAGLNPNLVYGQSASGASGNASPAPMSKAAEFNFDSPISDVSKFADTTMVPAQTNNLKTQNTVMEQEAILKAAQTAKLGTDNAKGKFDLGLAKELRDTSMSAAKANLRHMEAQGIQKELDNSVKSESKKGIIKDLYYKAEISAENLKGQKLLNNLRQLEVELKRIGIERNDPWYFRIIGRHMDEANKIIKSLKK